MLNINNLVSSPPPPSPFFEQLKSIGATLNVKFLREKEHSLPVHHPTTHFQIHHRPLSSCSQSELPHAIHEKSKMVIFLFFFFYKKLKLIKFNQLHHINQAHSRVTAK